MDNKVSETAFIKNKGWQNKTLAKKLCFLNKSAYEPSNFKFLILLGYKSWEVGTRIYYQCT